MAMPTFSMRQLLEAGVHFGHHTRRWNPKMRPFIFGVRNGVHIIDLQQSTPMLGTALQALRDIVAGGGRVLFVGTKRQAQEKVAESAKRCGQCDQKGDREGKVVARQRLRISVAQEQAPCGDETGEKLQGCRPRQA